MITKENRDWLARRRKNLWMGAANWPNSMLTMAFGYYHQQAFAGDSYCSNSKRNPGGLVYNDALSVRN
jgi:hypothetical protein